MNKIKQLFGLLLFVPALALAQSPEQNYVMTETVLNSSGSTMKSVQYYNGLGYLTVSVSTTGDGGQTSYSAITYDALGRACQGTVPWQVQMMQNNILSSNLKCVVLMCAIKN